MLTTEKPCRKCGQIFNNTPEFFTTIKRKSGSTYVTHCCRLCNKKKLADYFVNNPEAVKRQVRERHKTLRIQALNAYSNNNPKCSCCGEVHLEFLAIDHINNDGAEHRRKEKIKSGTMFFRWLYKNKYPQGFRVLCHNCNQSRGFYGYCPHEKTKQVSL